MATDLTALLGGGGSVLSKSVSIKVMGNGGRFGEEVQLGSVFNPAKCIVQVSNPSITNNNPDDTITQWWWEDTLDAIYVKWHEIATGNEYTVHTTWSYRVTVLEFN